MAADTALVTASISTDGHDGTIYDPEPDDPTVHDATDDDARANTDANDAAAADEGIATADDGTNGANATHGTETTVGLTEYVVVRPVSTYSLMLDSEWNHPRGRTFDDQGRTNG